RHRGKRVVLQRQCRGKKIAELVDRPVADAIQGVDDRAVDSNAGDQQKKLAVGAGGVKVDDAALIDRPIDLGGVPIQVQVLAQEVGRAQGDDDQWRDLLGAEGLQQELGDAAEGSIAADGDGGDHRLAFHSGGIDLRDAIEEKLNIDLARGKT